MNKVISILRGINVSGHNKIPMSELKSLYEELKFKNVTTYIQSGNVIFSTEQTDFTVLSKQIEKIIFKKYGFDAPVILRNINELQAIVNTNPFLKIKDIDIEKLHVSFLSNYPTKDYLEKIKTYHHESDVFIIKGKEAFVFCPNGYGKTKFTNIFFETKLKVTATTRNWRTINELLRIASAI